ncbi:hypothetical protein [Lactobacillus sp. PV034]|uniref:hypothetical protein n=1 Tax=Lactobacillus sp. PV034 TaxID=2594495 RepID=UPI002240A93B|nr:hypothetical protein [Lactobacillus sp. PV034]QNQ80750.1 hypothetical protein FP432_03880 [Lactobacillus sp. PV034]
MEKNYEEILTSLADGKLSEYKIEAKDAFAFQQALRNFGRRQDITGIAQRGGSIIYKQAENQV